MNDMQIVCFAFVVATGIIYNRLLQHGASAIDAFDKTTGLMQDHFEDWLHNPFIVAISA